MTVIATDRRKITWTPEDDAELRRIYAISSAGRASAALAALAIAKQIDRRSCYHRAEVLGISRVAGGHRPWTRAEDENLDAYAGRLPVHRIARILARSKASVKQRLHLRQISGRVKERGYTRQELAELLGVDYDRSPKCTFNLLLRQWPIPTNLLGNFAEDEVQLWVWEHMESLEFRRMNQLWLKSILRRAA